MFGAGDDDEEDEEELAIQEEVEFEEEEEVNIEDEEDDHGSNYEGVPVPRVQLNLSDEQLELLEQVRVSDEMCETKWVLAKRLLDQWHSEESLYVED